MLKRLLAIIFGSLLIIGGIIGLILPFTPGWAMIFIGLLFISPHHGKKATCWLKEKLKWRKS